MQAFMSGDHISFSVTADQIPGSIEISDSEHADLVRALNVDRKSVSVVDGKIVITDRIPTDEQLARKARRERDKLLGPTLAILDRHEKQARYGLPTTLTEAQAVEVAVYAQELRDVPEQAGFPRQIEWPVIPATMEG